VIRDVVEADFEQHVLVRSRELPVIVDFWAEWCGPCRQLGPALEQAVSSREGEVELAKVDVDSNQALATSFAVQGIPAVKAFRDGQVVSEFTGALPPARIEEFLNALVPSKADRLAAAGDEASLRSALEADPRHSGAAAALARILLERGETDAARELLEPIQGDFLADGLLARAHLTAANGDANVSDELAAAFAEWDAGNAGEALERLQAEISSEDDPERRDLVRRVMVAIFTELGPDHELSRSHRRRLASALS
jgi:putative thioredoxin